MRFKWTDWNRDHLARHRVRPEDAEEVLRSRRSLHSVRRDGTMVTIGRTYAGRRLFVVWREEDAKDIFADLESIIFVITAYDV